MNQDEEKRLQSICRLMLTDFLIEALTHGFTANPSVRENEFVEIFMERHNLK